MTMKAKPIGLYVHIPFCLKKCRYCDFCSFENAAKEKKVEYIAKLIEEIKSYKREPKICLDSVFFGGGTPSILEPAEFLSIGLAISEAFDVLEDTEFTVEVNPKTVTVEKCLAYKSAGVNRISIGMQSIHENELKKLGRIHNFSDFLCAYRLLSEHFSNISVDVMYGIPDQTLHSFEKTLDEVISLSPRHISVYGLMLEEGTPLYEMRDTISFPDEDEECDMYSLAVRKLGAGGYSHYEISNYAKDGFECRHNLKYWQANEYIGVGISAASRYGDRLFTNTDSLDEYLSGGGVNYIRKYEISDYKTEYIMLSLRLARGIVLSEYREIFKEDFLSDRRETLGEFLRLGYLKITDRSVALTDSGFYLSNYIISQLLDKNG